MLSDLLNEDAGAVAVCPRTWEAALAGRACTSVKVTMREIGIGFVMLSCSFFLSVVFFFLLGFELKFPPPPFYYPGIS